MHDSLRKNANVVEALESAMRSGNHALNAAPDLMCRTIAEGCWKRFVTKRGETVEHNSFEEFLNIIPLRGLGLSAEQARRVLAHDPVALNAFDEALGVSGTPNEDALPADRQAGPQRARALERLLEVKPQLYQEVEAGTRSVNSALVSAGLRSRTFTVKSGDANAAVRALKRHLTPDQLEDVKRLLAES